MGDRTVNPRLLIAHSPYWSREAPRPIQAPSLAAAIASSVPVCDGAGCEADLPNPIHELERPTLGRTFPIRSTSWSGRHWVGAATKVSRRPMAALSRHPCRDEPRQPARGLRRWLWRFWGRLCRRLPQLGIVVRWHRAARSRARAGAGARDVRAGASPAGDGRIPRRDCSSGSSAETRWLRVGQQELRVH